MALAAQIKASGSDPDADIIPALMRRNEAAFSMLVDRHLQTIQRLAHHMLGDPFMAEDVAQGVFLKTWEMLPDWQPGKARLLTWMRRVATNACLDTLRKKKPELMETLPDIASDSPSALTALEVQDQKKRVNEALAALCGNQRAALSLSYFQNVSQREGADILNISVSAYESLLVRARKSLKRELQISAGE